MSKFGTLNLNRADRGYIARKETDRATVQSFDDLGMLENERSKLQKLYFKIIQ